MTIRIATSHDAELIYSIKHQAYADCAIRARGNWDEVFQRSFTQQNLPLTQIIMVDSAPIGWIACQEHDEKIELIDIHILSSHQNRGLGTVAIRRVLANADVLGKRVELGVLKINLARSLYERLGFDVIGENATHILMKREPVPDTGTGAARLKD